MSSRLFGRGLAALVGLMVSSGGAVALGGYASEVVSYQAGSNSPSQYQDPKAALGAPDPLTGLSLGYPNVLSPFSPAYDPGQIVVIGSGGELTLQLAKPLAVAHQPQIGVISNVFLVDTTGNGTVGTPAQAEGGGSAQVLVSSDGKNFVSLGTIDFDLPANYFANVDSPYAAAAPANPVLADPAKPFAGSVSSFSGENFSQVLQTLNGSIGGTWIDVSASHLSSVDYVQFRVPAGVDRYLPIDAITTADSASTTGGGGGNGGQGTGVPLPAQGPVALCMMALLGIFAWLRRSTSGRRDRA